MVLSTRFEDALVYANVVHRNQRRKSTEIPYVSHLLGVASIVLEFDGDEDEAIAALLHDAAEDHGGERELEQILSRFGDRVAAIVAGCSDDMPEDPKDKLPWLERKAAYHAHIRATPDRSVLLVSAADKLHNATATVYALRRIGPSVWNRFNVGRKESLWNYRELVKAYSASVSSDERVEGVVSELHRIVEELSSDGGASRGD
jgi:GTP pyrophosphokinase